MIATAAVERCLSAIEDREAEVRAFAFLDRDRAKGEARLVDERGGGPLAGYVIGVKDVFDTADQPTAYGSPIFVGNRPRADAGAVALLRGAGAVVMGKTVTCELACFHPGVTTNPHRASHTPGGSSSGSAAAVAAGMVDAALGTQTAGSVVRPAAFCGVYGFKPTYGTVTVSGVKLVAPSLDTVGWFARDVDTLDALRCVLTGRPPAPLASRPPLLGVYRSEMWHDAQADTHAAVERVAEGGRARGAAVVDVATAVPAAIDGLAAEQPVVQGFEMARSLAWEHRTQRGLLSENLRSLLDHGASIPVADYDRVRGRAAEARAAIDDVFGSVDVLLTPAVVGEAPEGLSSTGDPRFCRLWTLLGCPTLSMPAGEGHTGLPVGVQLVGRPYHDAAVLTAAAWLAHAS